MHYHLTSRQNDNGRRFESYFEAQAYIASRSHRSDLSYQGCHRDHRAVLASVAQSAVTLDLTADFNWLAVPTIPTMPRRSVWDRLVTIVTGR